LFGRAVLTVLDDASRLVLRQEPSPRGLASYVKNATVGDLFRANRIFFRGSAPGLNQPQSKRGAERLALALRPFPFLGCPHTRKGNQARS
jgi:hypothetical protein